MAMQRVCVVCVVFSLVVGVLMVDGVPVDRVGNLQQRQQQQQGVEQQQQVQQQQQQQQQQGGSTSESTSEGVAPEQSITSESEEGSAAEQAEQEAGGSSGDVVVHNLDEGKEHELRAGWHQARVAQVAKDFATAGLSLHHRAFDYFDSNEYSSMESHETQDQAAKLLAEESSEDDGDSSASSSSSEGSDFDPEVYNCTDPPLRLAVGPVVIQCGTYINASQAGVQPSVIYPDAMENNYYTVVMVDPDAPSPKEPTEAEWRHWLVGNIVGIDLKKGILTGSTLTPFAPPTPPSGSGRHRYVVMVYEQAGGINFEPLDNDKRGKFNADAWAQRYAFARPIAVNFFTCSVE